MLVALQQYGSNQGSCTPDASVSHRDKINIRNGDYPIWGPLHLVSRMDANDRIRHVVSAFSHMENLPGVDGKRFLLNSGFVPFK